MQNYRIMHVVESLGGGVGHSVKTIIDGFCADVPAFVVHGQRDYTVGQFNFSEGVTLIPWSAKREISVGRDLLALHELIAVIRRVRPTLIHAHSTKAGVLARIAALLTATPCVYTPHSYAFLRSDVGRATRAFYTMVERILAPTATTIACGLEEYSYACRMSKRATVVENGVDTSRFVPRLPHELRSSERPTIVAVGRISPQKNLPLFLDISQDPALQNCDFIWITGEESVPETSFSNVEILGRLEPYMVSQKLREASIFINTSSWEGLSRAVLEAAAAGLPLVLSDAPGNRELGFRSRETYLFRTKLDAVRAIEAVLQRIDHDPTFGMANCAVVNQFYDTTKTQSRLRSIYDAIAFSASRARH